MPFQRIPNAVVDVDAHIRDYVGAIDGLWTLGNPAAAHAEIGTNGAGASGIRLYGPDGVTVLIDLDALTGDGTFQGDIVGSNISGSTVTGSTVTGSTVVGGTVETAASGQRAALEGAANRLAIYDVNGNLAGYIVGDLAGGFTVYANSTNWIELASTGVTANSQGGPLVLNSTHDVDISAGGTTNITGPVVASGPITSQAGDVTAAQTCKLTSPPTSATSPNATIGAGGRINLFTSARRFKRKIRRLRDGHRVLQLRAITYQDRDERKADRHSRRYWGFIAEDVEKVLPELVSYDDDGRPRGVMYDRVVVGLVDVVRDLADRLEAAGI